MAQEERNRMEKLYEEIKLKIVESGCTMQEAIKVLGLMEIACKNAIVSTQKPPPT